MHTKAQRQREIKSLAGLRGLAAMIVVVSHSANLGMLPENFGGGFGQTGVMLFFVLSGFLMSYLYADTDFNRESVTRYAFARIGRVLPLYYFLLIVSITVSVQVSGETFYPYIFDFKNGLLSLAIVKAPYVFWTIPVEIHFYFVFVLFWFVNVRFGLVYGAMLLLILALVPFMIIRTMFQAMPVIITTYMFSFVLGVFLSLWYTRNTDSIKIIKCSNYLGLPFLILLLINLPLIREQYFPASGSAFVRLWLNPLTWVLVVSVMVCAIYESRSLFLLRTRIAVLLGDVSFGIYLYHGPVIFFFAQNTDFPPLIKFIFSVITTVLIALLSLKYMEKPLNKRIRSVGNLVAKR